jgi:tripartite-type tricarboxylate transporter receptor subunit TctC
MKTIIRGIGFVTALAAAVGFAQTQPAGPYLSRPVRLVVGAPPGGNVDTLARVLVKQLETQLPYSIVVDNRGGASGILGYEIVRAAKIEKQ